jgi:hypothetical protein
MKIRLAAYLLGIFMASTLSGCVRSCYRSAETVLTQISIGDPSAPEVSIAKFPAVSQRDPSACLTPSPVRVELYIDMSGQVQGVTFLDSWPMDCANEYVRHMRFAKVVDTPLFHPLEHFRVDIHESLVSNRQCIRLEQ